MREMFWRWMRVGAGIGMGIALLALGVSAQKKPATRLSTDTPGFAVGDEPRMAADGDSVYVVWMDRRSLGRPDIYFTRSLDGGATWLDSDVRLNTDDPGQSDSRDPQIVVDGDSVYVAWVDFRRGFEDIYFNCSDDAGSTWMEQDLRIDHTPIEQATGLPLEGKSREPKLATLDGRVYLVWKDDRVRPFRGLFRADIYFNRSLDGGQTWMAEDLRLETFPAGEAQSDTPQLAVSGDSIFVCWKRKGIQFNRSLDRGVTWLPAEIRVDSASSRANSPQLAIEGDSVYVAWKDPRNWPLPSLPEGEDVYFNRSLDAGDSWLSEEVRVNTDAPGNDFIGAPFLSAEGSSVYVVWWDRRSDLPTLADIYFNRSHDGGSSWLASDIRLDTNAPGTGYRQAHKLPHLDRRSVWSGRKQELGIHLIFTSIDPWMGERRG